ncbi:P-loop containing nucleoside triphosphate hydrolase protein [Aspergillus falconensis]
MTSLYEDKDGQATEESTRAASGRMTRVAIAIMGVLGMATCVLQTTLAMNQRQDINWTRWVEAGIWVSRPLERRLVAVHLAQALAGSTISIFCGLIRRRPDVFYKGILVDRQSSTSLLGWLSFSWVEPVMRKCNSPRPPTVDELPELGYTTRAETVYTAWQAALPARDIVSVRNMWVALLRAHRRSLFNHFMPQIALLSLLNILEARRRGEKTDLLWIPVVGLGLSVMASATLESLKYWISYNKLAIQAQEQLSIAIFDKAILLYQTLNSASLKHPKNAHSPVNMLAVDVKNIADFLCFLFLMYESPLKMCIASALLVWLLGWQSFMAGTVVLVLLTIFNALAAGKYSSKQGSLMERRDSRLHVLTEMLSAIRQVKFSALETRWERKINGLRDAEMKAQWTVCVWQIVFVSLYFVGPILVSATCLSVYVILNGSISASTLFTSLSVLNSMEVSMTILPDIISFFLNAKVSMSRIQLFLAQPERVHCIVPSDTIEFRDATIAWPGCTDGALRDLTLRFPKGCLSIISGPTGSGKSLLLAAILGETEVLRGSVHSPIPTPFEDMACPGPLESWTTESALAFVGQSTWLKNASVRDNILLGLPMNEERYAKVIFACALEPDLELLPQRDLTEVSAKGETLSGGQRWRICLARALYSRAQTLLLDDIFSAVDVRTRNHIYQHALGGELLHERTCVLATHHEDQCLPLSRYVVRLKDGRLESATATNARDIESSSSKNVDMNHTGKEKDYENLSKSAGAAVFLRNGGNTFTWTMLVIAFLMSGSSMLARSWWIHIWIDDYEKSPATGVQHSVVHYIGVYLALSAAASVLGTCRTYVSMSAALRASKQMFCQLLLAVLRAPLHWHDTVSLGDIISRFSADINILDTRMGDDLRATLEYSTEVLMAVVAGAIANPFLLLVSAALMALYFIFAQRFVPASRHMKSLENSAKGPVLEEIDMALSGLSTLRAYGQANIASAQFRDKVNRHARAYWHLWLLNRWLGFRINVIGAALSTFSAAMVAYLPGVSPSIAGFAISFTIEVYLTMALSIRRYVNLEQGLNSMVRIHSYSTIRTEHSNDEASDKTITPPNLWPHEGRLEVSNLVVQYAPYLPPVLKGLSFTVEPNTRVGVVGRTGSGKSSLVLALFRFLEASHGTILVDGIDVSRVRLDQLRSRLQVIPQNPVLFRGTVRSNLDPLEEFDDATLSAALQAIGWRHPSTSPSSNPNASQQLSQLIEATNLSHGEKQLLCLARAIVRRPKILILDEATSAVDMDAETLIQRTLNSIVRQYQSTLLVIAHRLKTVADSDLILVMDHGEIVEAGSPGELLTREDGWFRRMVEQDSKRDGLIF